MADLYIKGKQALHPANGLLFFRGKMRSCTRDLKFKKYIFIMAILIFFLSLGITACSTQAVQVVRAQALQSSNRQFLEIRNCQDEEDFNIKLRDEVEAQPALMLADEMESSSSGQKVQIPSEVRDMLKTEINRTYADEARKAQSAIEEIELIIPVDRIRTFVILWDEQVYESYATFQYDGESYTASYTYKISTPTLENFLEMGCTG
jgi:hypothetical protein